MRGRKETSVSFAVLVFLTLWYLCTDLFMIIPECLVDFLVSL
jgi:hypothetical protein